MEELYHSVQGNNIGHSPGSIDSVSLFGMLPPKKASPRACDRRKKNTSVGTIQGIHLSFWPGDGDIWQAFGEKTATATTRTLNPLMYPLASPLMESKAKRVTVLSLRGFLWIGTRNNTIRTMGCWLALVQSRSVHAVK